MKKTIPILLFVLLMTGGCDQSQQTSSASPEDGPKTEQSAATTADAVSEPAETAEQTPVPPSPPLFENFQGQPQISLFPRVGPARPEKDDKLYPFWATYLDHLRRISGVTDRPVESNRAFSMRSINGVDTLGWFAPIAVTPDTRYRVSATFKANLPEGAVCGIGVIEFDRFLWIGDQFTRKQLDEHQRAASVLINLSGKIDWQPQSASFTTGPETRMIHLLFFRDGPGGKEPVLFDDVRIEKENGER
ncbi:hypothetical protein C2E25_06570 [Geothermobacter hydrogeniphilus]|uniref:Uncharacterized protein n=1 Tax=Geothermobacter hydrogeniphilus TaxID=1969733 RepID=A0A2K2HB55_9BACT|nr:hypothetical protein [Geothermobacter hydrogeniphilus]PNU20535.1 hypothetical protein C2E25_06570 [Geothermobacter hydrogeniphilus]